jgi:3-deoxy-manno-octulosonate cytidylyltransferase (CMP-KDO synthetase)
MKKVIIIPARLASTRLPNKPLTYIKGKSLIQRVVIQAQRTGITNILVACCDPLIKDEVEKIGGKALLTPPDLPSGTDRVYAAALKAQLANPENIIINVQGDLPFISPDDISKAATLLETSPHYDIATLAAPITNLEELDNPATVKIAFSPENRDLSVGRAHYFSRAPIPYGASLFYHHIGIYAFRFNALERFVQAEPTYLEKQEKLEQLRALDLNLKIGVKVVKETPLSIDTPADLKKAQRYLLHG